MGLFTPVAIKLGSQPWMPKLLPQITWTDTRLQRLTRGRLSILDLAGLPNLMLTVPGRRSGVSRSTPLLCVPWQGGWLVAGSHFGGPKAPAWTLNLRATETAHLSYRGRDHTCTWRELTGDEKAKAWAHMVTVWPNYDKYVAWTDRVIPVFLLSPSQ
ncbi:nitroreductase family deazaflavin-dependent oxidoreductase [Nocardioides daeguensis]|uniref:Nitroreductase family deazaflavin-dependent oxidoreductase n=1 Tax=Nocardioides daeguensis TaxID=908359 RepID=A0ABP6UYU1_9ACTN|nr:nitroreductase family deazaflavin-dependent oxidoreductase [Nocardioides daeguensis]MBV6727055.1 nitroreductase family deazaflavin-dependent oxidoreductase [Nocardioides daeguensis]MCR1771542.1 nitroreductase family deazaflavin-dependent oxidoreductase [Nocardioides daeguensis]